MVNGGRPPLPPRKRSSDPGMTPDTGEGGPRLPIPAIQVEADQGNTVVPPKTAVSADCRPSSRHSRRTITRPSTIPGQPSLLPPPFPVNRRSSFHHSRSTVARPSASSGQPPLRPHLLRPSGHLGTLGVAGASPAEKYPNERLGSRGGIPL